MAEEQEEEKKTAKHDRSCRDLEKVTDNDAGDDVQNDSASMAKAATNILTKSSHERLVAKETERRELMKVTINKADVELLMKELEIPKQLAELTLRKSGGDFMKAAAVLTE